MWTNEKPVETGRYWFYGDPFWDSLPHDEEKGINPFKPNMYVIDVAYVREGFVTCVTEGAFCYGKMKGIWWDEKLVAPEVPKELLK